MRVYLYFLIFASVFTFTLMPAPVYSGTPIEKEIELGQKTAKSMEKTTPVSKDQISQEEINRIGKSMLPFVNRKNLPYTFKIVRERYDGNNQLDAVSFPGGPVYISERFWRLLNPDERASVIAHEIAHIDRGDSLRFMHKIKKNGLENSYTLPDPESDPATWTFAESRAFAAYLGTMKYSRNQERDADLMAVDLMKSAGRNPVGAVTAMRKLLRLEEMPNKNQEKMLSTHPETKTRIEYLTARCVELGISPSDLESKHQPQLELPDCIGTVAEVSLQSIPIRIDTTATLALHDHVWIKKVLWDDESGKFAPTPIAYGHVTETGSSTRVQLTMVPPFEMIDIEVGDQVYPLKMVEQTEALGKVKSCTNEPLRIVVGAKSNLEVGQLVWIKDIQWDEKTKTVVPKPIAYGAVVSFLNGEAQIGGRILSGHRYEEIDQDCRVYPCKVVSDKTYMGEIIAKWDKPLRIVASSGREMKKGEEVWVKRLDWDDSINALAGRPIALGVVTEPGTHPEIKLKDVEDFPFWALVDNAGIYLRNSADLASRVGVVVSIDKRKSKITFSANQELTPGQIVCIKKQIWDPESQSLITQQVAKGSIVVTGKKTIVAAEPDSELDEIESGDEVYIEVAS